MKLLSKMDKAESGQAFILVLILLLVENVPRLRNTGRIIKDAPNYSGKGEVFFRIGN